MDNDYPSSELRKKKEPIFNKEAEKIAEDAIAKLNARIQAAYKNESNADL